MNMDTLTASLHAGLIQRARPAKVVPLRETGAVSGRASVVSLRASDVARARPAPPLGVVQRPTERTVEWPARAPGLAQVVALVERAAVPAAAATPPRRFGLTVRVGGELREMLLDVRMRTGRTAQSILHDALADHLAALERKRT